MDFYTYDNLDENVIVITRSKNAVQPVSISEIKLMILRKNYQLAIYWWLFCMSSGLSAKETSEAGFVQMGNLYRLNG
jgi:hypothetical protein